MTTKGEYALLWANGKTFGEIFDLMHAEILDSLTSPLSEWDGTARKIEGPDFVIELPEELSQADFEKFAVAFASFEPGDRVLYDENPGTIIEATPSQPAGFLVQWDNGHKSKVWASDLLAGEALDA